MQFTGTPLGDRLEGSGLDDIMEGLAGDDVILGRGDNDVIFGGAGSDYLYGENDDGANWRYENDSAGNDVLHGGDGDDYLDGGVGSDVLNGDAGNDNIVYMDRDFVNGGDGDDRITPLGEENFSNIYNTPHLLDGGAGTDFLRISVLSSEGVHFSIASPGIDQVIGSATIRNIEQIEYFGVEFSGGLGSDFIEGGNLNDQIVTGSGDDTVSGGGGDDQIFAGSGDDTVSGGGGDDRLGGDSGADKIYGGSGNDYLYVDADVFVDGGDGIDTASITRDTSVGETFALSPDRGSYVSSTFIVNVERMGFSAGSGNDVVVGGSLNDGIFGGAGDDLIDGGGGDDQLRGGAGHDTILGGLGDDTFQSSGNQEESGGEYDGGHGTDTLSIFEFNATAPITIDLAAGSFGATRLRNIELLSAQGSSAADILKGGDYSDRIAGGDGADIIAGNGGDDQLFGGEANDLIDGGSGNDVVGGGTGSDRITGGSGDDIIDGYYDSSFSSPDADELDGGAGNDIVRGSGGADVLSGGDGSDSLVGMFGNESLDGGPGDDVLDGGEGSDVFRGGEGDDQVYASAVLSYYPNRQIEFDSLLDGGGGTDRLHIDARAALAVTFTLREANTPSTLFGGTILGFESVEMFSGQYADSLTGGAAGDELHGGAGNDSIDGGHGADRLFGDGGDDALYSSEGGLLGNDLLVDGGSGIDHVYMNRGSTNAAISVNFSAAEGDLSVGSTIIRNVERLTLLAGSGADLVVGGYLDDDLNSGGGQDFLDGGAGNDALDGGLGADRVFGGIGDDIVKAFDADSEDILLDGGAGLDRVVIDRSSSTINIFVDLGSTADQLVGQTILRNFEALFLKAGEGNDQVAGSTLIDELSGGGGNDLLSGAGGNDRIDGGEGIDTLVLSGLRGNYRIGQADLQIVVEDIRATSGDGTDTVSGMEYVKFSDATVSISELVGPRVLAAGTGSSDTLSANSSSPWQIDGLGGDDDISGSVGSDILNGGDGNDRLLGAAGFDIIDGGSGTDTVLFSGNRSSYRAEYIQNTLQIRDMRLERPSGGAADALDVLKNVEIPNFNGSSLSPEGARQSTYSNESMRGSSGSDTYFFDTALGLPLGIDGVSDFGPGDRIVTTTRISDPNNDGVVRSNSSDRFVLPSAIGSTDQYTGSVKVVTSGGTTVGSLSLLNQQSVLGVDFFVYGAAGDGLASRGLEFDISAPTLKIASSDTSLEVGETATLTLSFSEAPSGFSTTDVVVESGTIGLLTATTDPKVFTLSYTPAPSTSDTAMQIIVAAESYKDSAGNLGAAAGLSLKVDTAPADTIYTGTADADEFTALTSANWTISGMGGNDILNGLAGADRLLGGENDDILKGAGGSDSIDGGLGVDTAVLSGARGDYVFSFVGGKLNAQDRRSGSPDGLDTLEGIEKLTFQGGDLKPQGAVQSSYLSETLSGTANKDVFFFDTALGLTLGSDGIKNFAAGDRVVTTSAIFDSNNDGRISVNSSDRYILPITTNDPLLSSGTLKLFSPTGGVVNSIRLDHVEQHAGVSFYVYAAGSDAVAGADLFGDSTPPVLQITSSDNTLTAGETAILTFAFSEAPVNFVAGDVTVESGTLGALTATSDPKLFTISYTPASNTQDAAMQIGVAAGSYADPAGNAGGAATLTLNVNTTPVQPSSYSGTEGADTFTATSSANWSISGLGGDDLLTGGAGHDTLLGGAGADQLKGGTGNDSLNGGAGADSVYGEGGDDSLYSYNEAGSLKDLLLDGGVGLDFLHIDRASSTAPILFSLANAADQTVDTVIIRGFERMTFLAGSGNDSLTGGIYDDQLYGRAGNDSLFGGLGNDTLDGAQGVDSLSGGDGDDILKSLHSAEGAKDVLLDGGAGVDLAEINRSSATAALTFSLANPTADRVFDGTTFRSIDRIDFTGGSANDTITGGNLNDLVAGAGGNDALDGGLGIDTAVLSGARGDYVFSLVGGKLTVQDLRVGSADGTDTLTNFEQLAFKGGDFKPIGALQSSYANDTLNGTASKDLFFFDTAAGLALGSDAIKGFGAGDRIVTTSAIYDSNNDGRISVNSSDRYVLPTTTGDPLLSSGTLKLFTGSGSIISSIRLDHVEQHSGLSFFVYAAAGDAVTGGELLW